METLTKHFKNLTKNVFQKHGFTQVELLQQWDAIMGPDLSAIIKPERIKWPQRNHGELSGGTLLLKSAPGRSLEAQYAVPQIQERINQYFGYYAIAVVKVAAGTENFNTSPKAITETPPSPALLQKLETITEPALKEALARLGTNLKNEAKRSPQAK